MRLIFSVLLFIFAQLSAYACALCALYTPTAHVSFSPTHMRWEFSSNFTQMLLASYDLNDNGSFEESELKEIKKALLDYLEPRNFLLDLSFYDLPMGKSEKISVKFSTISITATPNLSMDVDLSFIFKPRDQRVLRLVLNDPEGFFNFKILPNELNIKEFSSNVNINLASAFYQFHKNASKTPPAKTLLKSLASLESTQKAIMPQVPHKQNPTPLNDGFFSPILHFVQGILDLLISMIKRNSWLLYPLAFAYGALHALLPNHGKTFSAAYFSNRRFGAMIFALKVGFIHLASSYLAVLIFGFLALSKFNFASGYFVAAFAVFLIILKLARAKIVRIKSAQKTSKLKNFTALKTSSKITNFARKKSILDILAASLIGIIPCPGMVLVLGLIAPFGAPALGASVFIALGMSFSVYICAHISSRLNLGLKAQILLLALAAISAIAVANSGV